MLLVNKQAIAAAFDRAAASYSNHDSLQRRSSQELWTLLGIDNFARVLDAGCGPGGNSHVWRTYGSLVTALDLSQKMIAQARMHQTADMYLVADIEALPLLDASFDLVWSHLAVQWCNSLTKALSELYRVARPGGTIAFTTLLNHSLFELRQAWQSIDKYSHSNHFLSQEEVKMVLSPWHYRYNVQDVTLWFDDALTAMRSLKGIGATYLNNGRQRKMLTRTELQYLELAWPQKQGRFPLSYQLFHGIIKRD